MPVTLTLGGTSVTPRGYGYPVAWPRRRMQATQELAGGGLRVYDHGAEIAEVSLTWERLGKTDRDALLAFWRLVGAAKTAFTFTDHAGATHTVRWTNGWQESEVGYQIYSLTIALREEIAS